MTAPSISRALDLVVVIGDARDELATLLERDIDVGPVERPGAVRRDRGAQRAGTGGRRRIVQVRCSRAMAARTTQRRLRAARRRWENAMSSSPSDPPRAAHL